MYNLIFFMNFIESIVYRTLSQMYIKNTSSTCPNFYTELKAPIDQRPYAMKLVRVYKLHNTKLNAKEYSILNFAMISEWRNGTYCSAMLQKT